MHVIPWLSHEHCRYQHISCFSAFPYAIVVAVRPHFSHEIAVIGWAKAKQIPIESRNGLEVKIEGFRWLLNEKQNIRNDKSPRMDINFVLDTQKNRNQLKLDVWPQPHNSLWMLFFFRDCAWARISLRGRRKGNQYISSLRTGVLNSRVLKGNQTLESPDAQKYKRN